MRPLAIALLILAPSLAAAQTPLLWKFKEGDVFAYERIAKAEQATVLKGQTLKQEIRSAWVYRFEVAKANSADATLRVVIESVSVKNASGTTTIDNKQVEKMKGAILTVTASPRGEITALEGYDKLIEQIAEKRESAAAAARLNITEAVVRQEIQQILTILPKEPMTAGTRWQREGPPLETPPLGRFLVTLNGLTREIDRAGHYRLEGDLAGKYERPERRADFASIVGGNLTLDKGSWSCVFDHEAGRVLSQNLTLDIRGQLTLDVAGVVSPAEILIRHEVATRLLPKKRD